MASSQGQVQQVQLKTDEPEAVPAPEGGLQKILPGIEKNTTLLPENLLPENPLPENPAENQVLPTEGADNNETSVPVDPSAGAAAGAGLSKVTHASAELCFTALYEPKAECTDNTQCPIPDPCSTLLPTVFPEASQGTCVKPLNRRLQEQAVVPAQTEGGDVQIPAKPEVGQTEVGDVAQVPAETEVGLPPSNSDVVTPPMVNQCDLFDQAEITKFKNIDLTDLKRPGQICGDNYLEDAQFNPQTEQDCFGLAMRMLYWNNPLLSFGFNANTKKCVFYETACKTDTTKAKNTELAVKNFGSDAENNVDNWIGYNLFADNFAFPAQPAPEGGAAAPVNPAVKPAEGVEQLPVDQADNTNQVLTPEVKVPVESAEVPVKVEGAEVAEVAEVPVKVEDAKVAEVVPVPVEDAKLAEVAEAVEQPATRRLKTRSFSIQM